jgi:hypothetical protein
LEDPLLTLNPIELNRMSIEELQTTKVVLQSMLGMMDQLIMEKSDIPPGEITLTPAMEHWGFTNALDFIKSLRTLLPTQGLADAKKVYDTLKTGASVTLQHRSYDQKVYKRDLDRFASLFNLSVSTSIERP